MHELKARGSDGLERATLYAESCRNSPSFVLQDTQTRSFGSGRQHQLLLLLLLMSMYRIQSIDVYIYILIQQYTIDTHLSIYQFL